MTCETSGPEEALCAGVPAAIARHWTHDGWCRGRGENIRSRRTTEAEERQAEASNWAGFRKLEKVNVSSILNRLVTCQVAPKSRAAYT
jgi:hypothetical protein